MSPGDAAKRLGLFVLVVAVIVAGTAVVGSMRTTSTTDLGVEAPSQFQPGSALATVAPGEGTVDVEAEATGKTVLIDRSHGNGFAPGEIGAFVAALVENGYTVEFYGSVDRPGQDLNESLRGADAFVVINPTRQFAEEEVRGVRSFADGGGRVLLMGDPSTIRIVGLLGSTQSVDHDPTDLASPFGVSFGGGYLYNMNTERRANNYQSIHAVPVSEGSLAEGVDRVVMRDAAPIRTGAGATAVMAGAEGTALSTTRETGTYAVVARSGNVTAVGDTSFLDESSAHDADNEVLIANLIEFLVTGEKADPVPPTPGGEDGLGPQPPRPPRQPPSEGDEGGGDAGNGTSTSPPTTADRSG